MTGAGGKTPSDRLTERIVGVTVHATVLSIAQQLPVVAVMHIIGKAQDLSPTILP